MPNSDKPAGKTCTACSMHMSNLVDVAIFSMLEHMDAQGKTREDGIVTLLDCAARMAAVAIWHAANQAPDKLAFLHSIMDEHAQTTRSHVESRILIGAEPKGNA